MIDFKSTGPPFRVLELVHELLGQASYVEQVKDTIKEVNTTYGIYNEHNNTEDTSDYDLNFNISDQLFLETLTYDDKVIR